MLILDDAARWPRLFQWFGTIPRPEIEEWLRRSRLSIPPELIDLWQATGGGDVFESETILRPMVPSVPNRGLVGDDIESVNAPLAAVGNPHGLYIFQKGAFHSAVRLGDQEFVTLTGDHDVKHRYASLDEWYVHTLRAEFAERYGLGPLKS